MDAGAFVSLARVFQERFPFSRACPFASGNLPVNNHNHAFQERALVFKNNKDQDEHQLHWLSLAAGTLLSYLKVHL